MRLHATIKFILLNRMTFFADLALGNEWESKLLHYVEHDSVCFSPPLCKGWDVATTYQDHTVKWEVKSDRMACRTGNVAIETRYNGLPSGISSTEADYYAYFILQPATDPTLYMIPTDYLRTMVTKDYRVVRGGDRCASEMVLVPITDLYDFLF